MGAKEVTFCNSQRVHGNMRIYALQWSCFVSPIVSDERRLFQGRETTDRSMDTLISRSLLRVDKCDAKV